MKIDQKENLCNTMITSFMASAKQIAWRKKFAKMAKSGKFKKSKQLSQKERSKMIQTKRKEVHGDKRGMEQAELTALNRQIPQFEMVNMSPQSQKILDSMKKRRDILSKKY